MKDENLKKLESEKNPAHYCIGGCGKYLGFRGFCSEECYNKFYGDPEKD